MKSPSALSIALHDSSRKFRSFNRCISDWDVFELLVGVLVVVLVAILSVVLVPVLVALLLLLVQGANRLISTEQNNNATKYIKAKILSVVRHLNWIRSWPMICDMAN